MARFSVADYAKLEGMVHRVDPDPCADERRTLTDFLDFHRETLALKCAGLTAGQLAAR